MNEKALEAAEKAYPPPGYYPQIRHRLGLKAALEAALPHLRAGREEIARIIAGISCAKHWPQWQEALAKADAILHGEGRALEGERTSIIEQCAKVAEAYDMDGAFKDNMLPSRRPSHE